jgi:hypothetical protein
MALGVECGQLIRRIHVNQHVIKRNRKTGGREPVIAVKSSRGN